MRVRPLLVGLFTIALLAGLQPAGAVGSFPESPPNDPLYPPGSCQPTGKCGGPTGQWNLRSDSDNTLVPGASGISADQAWKVTTGRPDVVIGILDSGVQYDHEDLRNKIWLNRGELPVPSPAGGCTAAPATDPHDCNGDGVFNVQDYAGDPAVSDVNGDGALSRGDLSVFDNGVDDDSNGYVDDLSGYDFYDHDGDEFDSRYFGHGTGRAGIAAPETNNAKGVAGVCPGCPVMNVRIGQTYVCPSETVAEGAIYAADNGARVINMSLGCTTASTLARTAFRYATSKNVLAFNAMANEFSFHQNFQSVYDDVVGVGAITADNRSATTTFKQKANFSNFGAHLQIVAPTLVPGAEMGMNSNGMPNNSKYGDQESGTSSSTPEAAATAALVFSRARDLIDQAKLDVSQLALKDLSAEEVRQILNGSADDITAADERGYPAHAGWDKWTGYGRVNAKRAVDRVSQTTIPPEADINQPDWYHVVDGVVPVKFYANARWAKTFNWTIEWGEGVDPSTWHTLQSAASFPSDPNLSSADLVNNFDASWDTSGLPNDMYTLRLRAVDDLGNVGEDRMAVWVRHPTSQDLPGFPRDYPASLESLSTALVDVDGDNKLEIVFSDGDGRVHAVQANGQELPGFPVHTELPPGLPLQTSDAFDGSASNGEVDLSYSPILGGVAVADVNRDGRQEIIAGADDGHVYCWRWNAKPCPGFPVATDPGVVRYQYGQHEQVPANHASPIAATPALRDLDGDGKLEIVVGDVDQRLWVWHPNGNRMAPFPKTLFDPSSASGPSDLAPRAIISSAAIADLNGDGVREIVVGTNETYSSPNYQGLTGGSGRVYAIEPDGSYLPGWPVKPTSLSPSGVPLVAEGVGSSPVVADLNGDGKKEVITAAFLGDPTVYSANGQKVREMNDQAFGANGSGAKDSDETTPEGGPANRADSPSHFYVSQGAVADIDRDGKLDYLAGTVGNRLVPAALQPGVASSSSMQPGFDHLLSAWDATTGEYKAAYPRVMEDWQFFNGPTAADISGDGLPEIIESSGGYFVHALDVNGTEPAGWPKLTGMWQTASASIGDLDGDGHVEVVQPTRLGRLYVWTTNGNACQKDQWRKFRHDEWNTGTYVSDTRRPNRALDFTATPKATPGKVKLAWTAVGDDGPCGQAARYEIRVSGIRITERSFRHATPIQAPRPVPAGLPQSMGFTPADGMRFVALRAVDDAGNAGPIMTLPLP